MQKYCLRFCPGGQSTLHKAAFTKEKAAGIVSHGFYIKMEGLDPAPARSRHYFSILLYDGAIRGGDAHRCHHRADRLPVAGTSKSQTESKCLRTGAFQWVVARRITPDFFHSVRCCLQIASTCDPSANSSKRRLDTGQCPRVALGGLHAKVCFTLHPSGRRMVTQTGAGTPAKQLG